MFPPFGPPPSRDPSLGHPGGHHEPTGHLIAEQPVKTRSGWVTLCDHGWVDCPLCPREDRPRFAQLRRTARWLRRVARHALMGWAA